MILGNIDSLRDWGYAGDYVKAISMIVNRDTPDDFVVATGELHSLRDICEIAFEVIGLGDYQRYIRIDESLKRKNDTSGLIGNPTKIWNELGWKSKTSFRGMVESMLRFEKLN